MDPESLELTVPFQLTKTIRRQPYDAINIKNFSAKGKIILITGSSAGIGKAAAKVWARAGAEGVVLVARRPDKLKEAAAEVEAENSQTKVITVKCDVVVDKEVEEAYAKTIKTFGRSPDVVFANSGTVEPANIGDTSTDSWWYNLEVNLKGVYATLHHFIASQPNPKEPVGTFIVCNSGLAGVTPPGMSSYGVSKLGAERLVEFVEGEYPTLRPFTLFPGVILTDMAERAPQYKRFAQDHVDLPGMLCLYLDDPRADFLKGGLMSVNWDVTEVESHKEEILKDKALHIKWIPLLPASGGKGFES